MRAIILAAGRGSRLAEYAKDFPKCLLKLGGLSLLERQIRMFRDLGVDDIVIVKGFAAHRLHVEGVRFYLDRDHCNNMVYSLFCAEPEIDGDVIVSYADILFEHSVLRALIDAAPCDILVVADALWEEYFRQRFDKPFDKAESLTYDAEGRIREIGEPCPEPSSVQAQYIGLVRLSANGSRIFRQTYCRAKGQYWGTEWQRGRTFQKAHMTDFLQAMIDDGVAVHVLLIQHGWLEFDTATDYEKALLWHAAGTLDRFCSLDRGRLNRGSVAGDRRP